MTVYEADWIIPVSAAPIRNGSLAVDGETIAEVGRSVGITDRIRFHGCAIIPGFVNTHSHLELTILRGFLDSLDFTDWIPRLTRAKYQQLSREDILASTRLGAVEMLRAGVTCLGEVMDIGTSWEIMRELGIQGIAYQEVFGPAETDAENAMTRLTERVDTYRRSDSETRRVGVSPHAPYTVSPKLYRMVNEYAQRAGLPLTTHIAESEAEGMFVRWGAGVFAERLSERGISFFPAGCSPVAYLDSLGLIRSGVLLVHAIDLEDSDLEILRIKRPAVAHCPKSNAKLAHGIARLSDIGEAGVAVGLGTDSVASNNVVDMFEEMRAAIFQQRSRTRRHEVLDARAVLRMATLGGAECLGLSERLGSLEAGKRADFVVVDLNDPATQPVYDPIDAMVYSASRHNVRATYVGGREVRIDPTEIMRECALVSQKLKE